MYDTRRRRLNATLMSPNQEFLQGTRHETSHIVLRLSSLAEQLRKFAAATSGQIAILFGLVGDGDCSWRPEVGSTSAAPTRRDRSCRRWPRSRASTRAGRALSTRSRRPIRDRTGPTTYLNNVKSYINATLTNQQFAPLTQTNANPFTFTVGRSGGREPHVQRADRLHGDRTAITQVPVAATAHCYDNLRRASRRPWPMGMPEFCEPLSQEGFENSAPAAGHATAFISPTES